MGNQNQQASNGLLFSLVFAGAVYCFSATASCLCAATPVTVHIRPKANIVEDTVRLQDVAEIYGGDASDRRQIGELDLAELNNESTEKTFPKTLVEVRIRLAGFKPEDYRIVGPKEVLVQRLQGELTDIQVVQDLQSGLTKHWQLPEGAVELQLLEPLETALRRARVDRLSNDLRASPLVEPTDVPGRMRLRVGIYREDQLINTLMLHVTVVVKRPVAVALTSIRAKQTIVAEDVTYDQKALTGRAALQTQIDPIGRVAKRYIEHGEPILPADVDAPADAVTVKTNNEGTQQKAAPAEKVKRSSRVKVVVRTRGVLVTLNNAELMRDAKVGDIVEVKNPTSKMTVQGRLVSPSTVEVSL